jgi:uncharacterized protein YkwD
LAAAALVAGLSACGPLAWSAGHGGQTQPASSAAANVRKHHPRPAPTQPVSTPSTPVTTAPVTTPPVTTPPVTTPPVTTPPVSTPTQSVSDAYEARILVLVNEERAKAGLGALALSPCADTFAENWAPVIQANGALSHQSLGPIMNTCHVNAAGENVAYGNVTADQMMTMWMNSPGHRANILSPSYKAIGIAAVTDASGRWYGVQDFTG